MSPVLPRAVQQKLDQTLAQWRQWHCAIALQRAPQVVHVLAPGISNYSVLVESTQRFVVRIDGIKPSTNGLSRQSEWHALEAAARAGLAPQPRYFNPDLGSLVCDYLAPAGSQSLSPGEVGVLLRNIHRLPPSHHRLDLRERILRYERLLEHRGRTASERLRSCQQPVVELLSGLNQLPDPPVLCHNDLLRANRIYSGDRLWAIDWEYCAMGSPWYDIAVVVNGDSLGEKETQALLLAYLGRAADTGEQATLHHYGCVYRYLELLWYLALERPLLSPDAIAAKETTLLHQLQQ